MTATAEMLDALVDLIAERVAAKLALVPPPAPAPAPSEWITPEQLAAELGYERHTIPVLVRRRGLPCHRVGRKMRFRRSDVDAWIARGSR